MQLVEGLTEFTGQLNQTNKGKFPLPVEFDSKKFVGKWVKNGFAVESAKQSTPIPSEGLVATGWEVWLDKNKKPCLRSVSTGAFILMFRPKVLQTALNKIYGNMSKKRMIMEAEGDSLSTGQVGGTTSGMITRKTMSNIPGLRSELESEPALQEAVTMNDLQPEQVENPVQAHVQIPSKGKGSKAFLNQES